MERPSHHHGDPRDNSSGHHAITPGPCARPSWRVPAPDPLPALAPLMTLPRALLLPPDMAGGGGLGSQPSEAHGEPPPELLPAALQPVGVAGVTPTGLQAAEPQGYEAQMQAVRDVLLMVQAGQGWP